ncbi:MAG: type II secretion system F family protein [Planctomycetota bacterium]
MPLFEYRAIDHAGKRRVGRLAANHQGALASHLDNLGLILVKAREVAAHGGRFRSGGPVSLKDLISFTHHLVMLFSSGVPIIAGIRAIKEEMQADAMKPVLDDIEARLEAGQSLSESFAAHPKIFDRTYLSILAAGEESGALDQVMTRLLEHLEWRAETRGKVGQALIYPAILSLAVIGLIVLLLTFMLPRIAGVYDKLRVDLPKPTVMLLDLSKFMQHNWAMLLIGVAGTLFAVVAANRLPSGRLCFDRLKLRMPVFGPLIRKSQAAQFCHTLATLYEAGVALPRSLSIVAATLNNRVLGQAVAQSATDITEGRMLGESLRASGVFQPLVIRMVQTGEEMGDLGGALGRVNRFYDREVPQAVKKMIALMEPIIIVFAGASVAFIVLCTLLPIFRLFSALRGG